MNGEYPDVRLCIQHEFKPKAMNRRKFSKVTSLSLLGSGILANFTLGATQFKSDSKLRLGGPIFDKYDSPEAWIRAVKKLGYSAAYCPLGPTASIEEIKAYENAAKKADIIIAEVGAWSNPISPDPKIAKEAFEKCTASLELADQIGAKCCVNIAGSEIG